MPIYRCKCGRKIDYDVVSGKFREMDEEEDSIIKIRCSAQTKDAFKKLKDSTELPSYEALLLMLMSGGILSLPKTS
jgi:hypothetical protein